MESEETEEDGERGVVDPPAVEEAGC